MQLVHSFSPFGVHVVAEAAAPMTHGLAQHFTHRAVQPLYLKAASGEIPELKRVVVAYQNQVIMDETLSGQLLEAVADTPCDSVFTVFGKDVSMGKGMGLMGITDLITTYARQRLKARQGA